VQHDPPGLFSWFKAIAQGIRLWVSGPDEPNGPEHAEAETAAPSIGSSATSTSTTVKSLTLHNESNEQSSGINNAHTTNGNYGGNFHHTRSCGSEMVLDENFWEIFISNWPDMTMPFGAWKRGMT
jgi:hypothetical protein